MHRSHVALGVALFLAVGASSADPPAQRTPKEALKDLQDLVGSWKCTCTPDGTKEEQRKNFWIETMSWEWHFKGKDAWLSVEFDKGKFFDKGEMRYLPEKDTYELKLKTTAKDTITFTGALKEKLLILEQLDEAKNESKRLTFTLLHSNRILYKYDTKRPGKALYAKLYNSGATKEGVPFAVGDGKPECIVTGGAGTIAVTYMGGTYYVCCSGCRDEFNDNPAKYVNAFKAKQKKK